jgi:hypothetical protein
MLIISFSPTGRLLTSTILSLLIPHSCLAPFPILLFSLLFLFIFFSFLLFLFLSLPFVTFSYIFLSYILLSICFLSPLILNFFSVILVSFPLHPISLLSTSSCYLSVFKVDGCALNLPPARHGCTNVQRQRLLPSLRRPPYRSQQTSKQ